MRRALASGAAALLVFACVAAVRPEPTRAITLLANADTATVRHDHTLTVPPAGVLANDVGLLGGTVVLVSTVSHGTLDLNADGSYTYTPDSGYVGADLFQYKVRSLLLITSNTANVTISVTNAAPVARADTYTVSGRNDLVVGAPGVLGNDTDADGDRLTAQLQSSSGLSGSFDFNPDGSFTYRPGGGFDGFATFTYRASDGSAASATVTVTLTGTPTPTAIPTATPQPTVRATPMPIPLPTLPPLPTVQPLPTIAPLPTLPPLPSLGPLPSLTPLPTLPPLLSPPPVPVPTLSPPGSSISPTASASASASPRPGAATPSPSPRSSGAPAVVPGAAGPRPGDGQISGGGGPVDGVAPRVGVGLGGIGVQTRAPLGGVALDLGDLQLGDLWYVPAGLLGLPGLLLLLWLAAEAAGGLVWLPAARRLSREEAGPRRLGDPKQPRSRH